MKKEKITFGQSYEAPALICVNLRLHTLIAASETGNIASPGDLTSSDEEGFFTDL